VVGDLDLAQAVTLAELEAMDEVGRAGRLQAVDALLQSLPAVVVEGAAAERFSHGNPVDLPPGLGGKIRVYAADRLIGVGEPGPDGRLWPKRLVQLAA
jgi:tRNA pseudouridine55 synthase